MAVLAQGQAELVHLGDVAFILGIVAAVLTIALLTKKLFATPAPVVIAQPGDANAKKNDVDNLKEQLDEKLANLKKELSLKLDNLAAKDTVTMLSTRMLAMEKAHEKLDDYTHKWVHKLDTMLQTFSNKLTVIQTLMMTIPGIRVPPAVQNAIEKAAQGTDDALPSLLDTDEETRH